MICRPSCTSSDSLFPRVRDGWTIIEVLVTIAVISVLLSVSLVGLRGIRDKRDQIACLANIGGMGKILAAYGADNRDLFPSWVERGRDYAASDAGRRWWAYQPIGTLQSQRWLDYADFETTTETMYCPANDWLPDKYEDQAAPDFVLSSAFYMTPSYLDPGLPRAAWHDRLGAKFRNHLRCAIRHPRRDSLRRRSGMVGGACFRMERMSANWSIGSRGCLGRYFSWTGTRPAFMNGMEFVRSGVRQCGLC